ncbi:MAG: DNA polymerase I [Chlorobiaceae bacterium]|nr:DNA polymerase I [Chlorobiaceae bacterium]
MSRKQLDFFPSCTPETAVTPPKPASEKPKLILIDGMAMVYRAFFALQRAGMKSRDGMPTGAVYGFATALLKIFESYKPDYLAAAFDSREKTFRHDLYSPYKANRSAPPEDLISQLDAIFELLAAFDIPLIKIPGYEADDLIGTASRIFAPECRVFIVTPDKDLAQLVQEGVSILRPGKNQNELELLGRKEISDQFGVPPEQFTDLLSLTGDTSDNIPGAKGIGPKTAATLLGKYGTLKNIYLHLGELSAKTRVSLEEFQPQLDLIKQLVTIRTDLNIDLSLSALACGSPDRTTLMPLLKKLELKTVIARLPILFPHFEEQASLEAVPHEERDNPDTDTAPELRSPRTGADYGTITTKEELASFISSLQGAPRIAVDTETTSLNTFEAELAGISISTEARKARFIALANSSLKPQEALELLKPLLSSPQLPKTGQNLKYDILVLKKYGVDLSPVGFDTMLASYVLDPEEKHNLDDLAARHLGYKTTTFDELTGTGKGKLHIFDVEPEKLSDYACQDADLALQLEDTFRKKLEGEKELLWLCEHIEFPLVSVLASMEHAGICIDTPHLEKTSASVGMELELLTEKIYEAAGAPFNIDSPKQLSNILFNVLALPTKKTTKTGFSTNVEVLEELAELHPVVKSLLEYRTLQKLKSTYIDALPKLVNPATGRLHTSFNQFITATGRLSSSNPNLQNIPIRSPLGKEIRRAFIPSSPEKWLLSADYSQIELRIAAEISGDPQLIEAFRNREDIHTATARVIFNTDNITSDMRRKAKEVNFGVLYGIMPFGLSKRLNIPRSEATIIIETYKSKYPGLFLALQNIIETGKTDGYVSTLLGRRRYIADLNSRNNNIQKAAERAAMNTPIQGTAADIIKCAMNLCSLRMREHSMKSVMLLQVHDELLFETTDEEKEPLSAMIEQAMIDAAITCGLNNVPVEVDTGIGKNWLDAH